MHFVEINFNVNHQQEYAHEYQAKINCKKHHQMYHMTPYNNYCFLLKNVISEMIKCWYLFVQNLLKSNIT